MIEPVRSAAEAQALSVIDRTDDAAALRRIMRNAGGKSEAVERAAFARLVRLDIGPDEEPVSRACWEMVHTVEELRRKAGRKVWKMNRLRPKIAKEGAQAALSYCARNRTDGFDEVIAYGMPELTAEAIVLSMPEEFSDKDLRQAAAERLTAAGVDAARFVPMAG